MEENKDTPSDYQKGAKGVRTLPDLLAEGALICYHKYEGENFSKVIL